MTRESRSRREVLKALAATGALTALPDSITRALAMPAHNRTGTIEDVEHIVILMQENRSFDHYFGTMRGVRGFGDPRAMKLPSGELRLAPARRRRRPAAVPPARRRPGRDLPARSAARLERQARAPGTRAGTTSGSPNKGMSTMTYTPAQRPTLPLRAGRRLHHLRRLPLLADGADRSEPLPPVDRLGRQRRQRAAARSITNAELGYDWSTYPERLRAHGISLEGLPGQGRRAGRERRRLLGLDRRPLHRQLRRQLAAVLPPVPERACPARRWPTRAKTGTDDQAPEPRPDAAARHLPRRRARRVACRR